MRRYSQLKEMKINPQTTNFIDSKQFTPIKITYTYIKISLCKKKLSIMSDGRSSKMKIPGQSKIPYLHFLNLPLVNTRDENVTSLLLVQNLEGLNPRHCSGCWLQKTPKIKCTAELNALTGKASFTNSVETRENYINDSFINFMVTKFFLHNLIKCNYNEYICYQPKK